MTAPAIPLAFLGPPGHGKSLLLRALGTCFPPEDPGEDVLSPLLPEGIRGWTRASFVSRRHYQAMEFSPPDSFWSRVLPAGVFQVRSAVVVVAADEGPSPEAFGMLRLLDLEPAAVFLNRTDQVDDPGLLDLAEWEVRRTLSEFGFPGDDIPIVRGSAWLAVAATEPQDPACDCLREFLRALDDVPLTPVEPGPQGPFLMAIGRPVAAQFGPRVVGRVLRGQVQPGDRLAVLDPNLERELLVHHLEPAPPGHPDLARLVSAAQQLQLLGSGYLLGQPGSMTLSPQFEVELLPLRPGRLSAGQAAYLQLRIGGLGPFGRLIPLARPTPLTLARFESHGRPVPVEVGMIVGFFSGEKPEALGRVTRLLE